jgi:hypothetical protein
VLQRAQLVQLPLGRRDLMAGLGSGALRLRARVGELGPGLLGGGGEDPASVRALRGLVVGERGERSSSCAVRHSVSNSWRSASERSRSLSASAWARVRTWAALVVARLRMSLTSSWTMRVICCRRSLIPSTVCGIVDSAATCPCSSSASARCWVLTARADWMSPMPASSLRESASNWARAECLAEVAARSCAESTSSCASTWVRS